MGTRVTVRVPASLRQFTDGRAALDLEFDPHGDPIGPSGAGPTVATVLDRLARDHPALERRVRDETAALRRHVNVFVGADNIRDAAGQDTPVVDGSEVSILPAVSGG